MTLYAAFDTSATTTVICIIAGRDGSPVFETTVPTDPDALYQALAPYLPRLQRVGVEAGSWSAWLHRELTARGVPMVILETRHAAAALQAQRNKTDKNDARGLAQLVRSGWFKTVHAKSEASHRLKLLLAHRRTLKRKLLDIENEVRHSIKALGLMVGRRVGLTPRREQSGTSIDRDGHISRRGDGEVRTVLYEAASSMLTRSQTWSTLKAWGVRVSAKRGHKRAVVAVARKLAVIMHRMWLDGSEFRFSVAEAAPIAAATA